MTTPARTFGNSQNSRAILWVLLGTALFTIVFASGKLVGGTVPPVQITFLRYISGFVTLIMVVTVMGRQLRGYRSRKPAAHFMRAFLGCYGGLAIIYSSANMPILDATAISLLYVIFIVGLGVVLLKEHISGQHWVAIALSSLGAATIVGSRGAFQTFDASYLWPAMVALAGAILIAFESILIRTLSQSEKSLTVLLYVNFFGIFLMAVPAWFAWRPMEGAQVAFIMALGPIAIAAQYCVIRGYRMANVSVLGPVDYSWLIFAGLIGFLFFGEVPTPGVLVGVALISVGGIMLGLMKRR